jgi:hypothetical protein
MSTAPPTANRELPVSPVGTTPVDGAMSTVSNGKRGLTRTFRVLVPGSTNS